jgi:hypothetical protein
MTGTATKIKSGSSAAISHICAQITDVDADENREIVVKGNYTLAIIRKSEATS